jgi:protein-S-isoprenylcysteine O-methyltransferase Ste14
MYPGGVPAERVPRGEVPVSGVIQGLFSSVPLRRFLFRTRYLLALVLAVPLARYLEPQRLPVALAISLFGQLIQGWCFASLVKNVELTIRGPYVLVRNPMYLGRYFIVLGFVWLLDSWWAVGALTLVYLLYMVHRVRREEGRLRRAYRERFEAYCNEVNRFLPSLGRSGDPRIRYWDHAIFIENHGHWNILLTLGAFAAAYGLHLLLFARG